MTAQHRAAIEREIDHLVRMCRRTQRLDERLDVFRACLALDQQEAQGCETCEYAGSHILECGDLGAGRVCTHPDVRYLNDGEGLGAETIMPVTIDGQPFGCRGWRAKEDAQ